MITRKIELFGKAARAFLYTAEMPCRDGVRLEMGVCEYNNQTNSFDKLMAVQLPMSDTVGHMFEFQRLIDKVQAAGWKFT